MTVDFLSERKTILYVGNKLSKHGYTPTNVETLGVELGSYYNMITVSDKKSKLLRLLDILVTIIKNKKRTDVIIIDTYSTSAFLFARLSGALAFYFRIPYIPILHGGNLPAALKKFSSGQLKFFTRAARLVAPSQYLFRQFQQFNFQQLILIPNTINIQDYYFKERTYVKLNLFWVRSFHEIYNCSMALHVLKKLLAIYPDASLCMVGPEKDGSLAKTKALAEELGLAGRVVFTGMLAKDAWHKLSEQYDIFINTTNVDNTPVSVIESLALGLPVISTNVGGIPYLVEHERNALLVQAGDIDAMANEIEKLIEQPVLAGKLSNAGRRLAESFDWEKVKYQWKGLIDTVIN